MRLFGSLVKAEMVIYYVYVVVDYILHIDKNVLLQEWIEIEDKS